MQSKGTIYLRSVCTSVCMFANVDTNFDGTKYDGEPKCGVGLSLLQIEEKFDGVGCDKSAIAVSKITGVDPASKKWIDTRLDILVHPVVLGLGTPGGIGSKIIKQEQGIIPLSEHLANIGFRK